MLNRFLRVLAFTMCAHSAARCSQPSEFHIVSVAFSDFGALFYYRVIDVKASGSDSEVRFIRIAPRDVYCPRWIVQSAETRVAGKSPSQLAGNNNPCAVTPNALHGVLRQYRQRAGTFETGSMGLSARCEHSGITVGLPDSQGLRFDEMKAAHPAIARLWELASKVTSLAFGADDLFDNRSEAEDLALQQEGEKIIPELTSGRYDRALSDAVGGNIGTWKHPAFRSLLANYQGPISAKQTAADMTPTLVNGTNYHLVRYVVPTYPALAKAVRIQGTVRLRLDMESGTGDVLSATVLSGHPLLARSALLAAKQWRFEPHSLESEAAEVSLNFALGCQ